MIIASGGEASSVGVTLGVSRVELALEAVALFERSLEFSVEVGVLRVVGVGLRAFVNPFSSKVARGNSRRRPTFDQDKAGRNPVTAQAQGTGPQWRERRGTRSDAPEAEPTEVSFSFTRSFLAPAPAPFAVADALEESASAVPSGASFPCRLLEKHPPMFAYAPPRLLTSSFSNERHCRVMPSISADFSLECNQAHLARAHAIRKSSCMR